MLERDLVLDISRLIWRAWSPRRATGIERVCSAYMEHFKDHAHAMIQYRGRFRILSATHSDRVFAMLLDRDDSFRRKLLALAPAALAQARSKTDCRGAFYINVGHTDIDLDALMRWTDACGLRAIYLIHDLIPVTHSEFCNPHAVVRHRGRVTNALTHAAGIITNSQASAQELASFAEAEGLRHPPLLAALLAGETLVRPSAPAGKARPHFLCVGTIEARKNHYLLLQIWRRLAERLGAATPLLVIVGQKGAQAGHVESMLERCAALQGHVITLPDCSDAELGGWMASARALLIPSFAEGFGLPLVEALQLGTPVIASDLACFHEIGDGIPTFLDPLDAPAWERAILSFRDDTPERARQLHALPAYRAPSWETHFDRVEAWIATLPHRTPSGGPSRPAHGAALPDGLV